MRKVFLPPDLKTFWSMKADYPQALVYAGGTDLLVRLRLRLSDSPVLICLERIEELKGIEDRGREVLIRAGTTHAAALAHPLIQRHFPVLSQALRVLGSPPIRHMGTLGGNLVTASPAGDTLPPLTVLEAEVEIQKSNARHRLAIKDFLLGPGLTSLKADELVTGVWIKKQPGTILQYFEKVGQRKSLAIALVSMAAALKMEKGIVQSARLAWGSVGPTVIRCPEAEAILKGHPLTAALLEKAAASIRQSVTPITDLRAGAEYRRQVAGNLLFRLLDLVPKN
ncbi:MAG: xanthine dehydrogenase family protein subunit M [Thermodesulfobacteriota bacterium]